VRVVLTLLVRDEEDVLPATLAHHYEHGVDFVVATDNGSVDGTVALLEAEERAGRLRLIHEPEDTYDQHRWVTRMARLAATEHGADWVVNSDADELWWAAEGDLASTLAGVPDGVDVVVAHRYNLIARPEGEPMTVRQATSRPHPGMGDEPLPPKVCHRADPEVTVLQGNHEVTGPRLGGEPLDDGRLLILHAPVRSYAQFANKIAKGGAAYERNAELPTEVGHQWRRLHRLQQEGAFDDEWARLVLDDAAVAAGLADGSLVEDDRFWARYSGSGPPR
jgi:Glycosyl transferase family 2